MMRLKDILKGSGVIGPALSDNPVVTGVCIDSRKACRGCLFVAVKGCVQDGVKYIPEAIAKGAVAVVYETGSEVEVRKGVVFVSVVSSRHALAVIAGNFYDHPSGKLCLVGVTGTNGKTTTVTLLYELFTSLGYHCGMLSTIVNCVGNKKLETTNTTSDPITINYLLSEMVEEGCRYCFMEVSSIGLDQERTAGLKFRAGIFSNLTHDHLDYHKSFERYLRCKKLFFDGLGSDAVAVVNMDDKNGKVMVQNCKAQVVSYSCRALADHTCRIMEKSMEGMELRIDGKEIWTRLIGQHNAYNLLCAYSTAVNIGAEPEEALLGLSKLQPAKGRLEVIRGPKGISAVIDYAHTPDALDNVLKTLRSVAPRQQLSCLFGCGGDRDKTKRPEMAKVAEEWADKIFVTSDNSRSEKTEDIMSDIMAGFSPKGRAKTIAIANRKEAIGAALMTAPDGAVVLLAGKGHETYQIMGGEHNHFDEREIVAECFAAMED